VIAGEVFQKTAQITSSSIHLLIKVPYTCLYCGTKGYFPASGSVCAFFPLPDPGLSQDLDMHQPPASSPQISKACMSWPERSGDTLSLLF